MKKAFTICFALVIILTLFVRIILEFQTPYFSTPESYNDLRQIETIASTGVPLVHDELSYGGRTHLFLPGFYYLLALFAWFGDGMIKLILALLTVSVIIPLYLIIKYLTHNKWVALITAAVSNFIPAYMNLTINTITPHHIIVPLLLWFMYFFMKLNKRRFLILTLITYGALLIISPFFIVILLGILGYYLLNKVEELPVSQLETEIIVFMTVFTMWLYIVYFKKAIVLHGYQIIWQNIPPLILTNYFSEITVFTALVSIGIVPLIGGTYTLFKYMFKSKEKPLYIIISLNLTIIGLLWLRFITLEVGLVYLGISFLILGGKWFDDCMIYINNTHYPKLKYVLGILTIGIMIATMVMPSISHALEKINRAPTEEYREAFYAIKDYTLPTDTVATSLEEGYLITYFAERKNIADMDFIMISDARERSEDLKTLFTTISTVKAIEILEKYTADYLFVSQRMKERYNPSILFTAENSCFIPLYQNNEAEIYKNTCTIKKEVEYS